jgi:CubicO group peptidase (beta-lactamase class C family)
MMMSMKLEGIDEHIEQALAQWELPGAAVAVIRGTELVHASGYGVRETGSDARVDTQTLFEIGSVTKPFTTTALGLLVDEGRLQWEDPVCQHLPHFQLHDPWLTRHVTVRDTVIHSSGFLDPISYGIQVMSADEALRRMRHNPAFDAFRRSFNYSNFMFNVAGKVIEVASGTSWGEFIRTRIFDPLGMKRSGTSAHDFWDSQYVAPTIFGTAAASSVSATLARDANVAMPHTLEDGPARPIPWRSYDSLAAAGSLVSSVEDLARWLTMHINEGVFAGQRIMTSETVRELQRSQNAHYVSVSPFDAEGGSGAIGWFRERYRGHLHVSHGGVILGFTARACFLPEHKIGVVVLTNGQRTTYERYTAGHAPDFFHKSVSLWVFDRLLGHPDSDWNGHFQEQMRRADAACEAKEAELAAARAPASTALVPLERYVGTYEDRTGLHGRLQITVEDGQLWLANADPRAYRARLEPWFATTFRLCSEGVRYFSFFVQFVFSPQGRVAVVRAFDGEFHAQ